MVLNKIAVAVWTSSPRSVAMMMIEVDLTERNVIEVGQRFDIGNG